jgi:uncharacterized protein (DUF362 family)
MSQRVAIGITTAAYNGDPPYHPDRPYPELPFSETSATLNHPYHLLRELFHRLGYDAEHVGTAQWNPLRAVIQPGQTVLLKPNFVLSFNTSGHSLFAIVTHPSILRAVIDYVYLALNGKGRIIIADAPQMDCNWEELMAAQRLDLVREFYQKKFDFPIELYDLRNFTLVDSHQPAYSGNRKSLAGDPLGSAIVNLGSNSEFYGRPSENYYGADFNRAETIRHHQGSTHEYSISRTVLSADVFISVPKMKVHKKVGVTLNLKGLVGINTNKNFLVHHTVGTPREGGDQLPDDITTTERFVRKAQRWFSDWALAKQTRWGDFTYKTTATVYRTFIKPFRHDPESVMLMDAGNWHGNDSAWRMATDLAKILFFADKHGQIRPTLQRKLLCVVDGIIAGENCGPLSPDAKPCGCLVVGESPFAVDMVTARLMGFDIRKIRQFDAALGNRWDFGVHSLRDIEILYDKGQVDGEGFFDPAWNGPQFNFTPHPGWRGHIELPSAGPVS